MALAGQIIIWVVSLLGAFGLGALVLEMYKRHNSMVDLSITNNKEIRVAEMTHEERFLALVLGQVDKLTLAERMLIDEKIEMNKTITNLEARVHEFEIKELEHEIEIRDYKIEIRRWKEAVEMRDSQIARLQQAIADITAEINRLREIIARKGGTNEDQQQGD